MRRVDVVFSPPIQFGCNSCISHEDKYLAKPSASDRYFIKRLIDDSDRQIVKYLCATSMLHVSTFTYSFETRGVVFNLQNVSVGDRLACFDDSYLWSRAWQRSNVIVFSSRHSPSKAVQ